MKVFIPFNVPSSKNSKVATKRGVFHSKTVRKYLQKLGVKHYSAKNGVENYKTRPNLFAACIEPLKEYLEAEQPPYKFEFHFVRDSRRSFDYINACQILADLMVAHRVIPDDNMKYFEPIKWGYEINKKKPGVWIRAAGE